MFDFDKAVKKYGYSLKSLDYSSQRLQDERIHRILCLLQMRAARRVLDVGCGFGGLLDASMDVAEDMGPISEYVGIDTSEEILKIARQLWPHEYEHFIHMNGLTDEIPKEKFDAIVCVGVLAYYPRADQERAVNRFLARTKDCVICTFRVRNLGRKRPAGEYPVTTRWILDRWQAATQIVYVDDYHPREVMVMLTKKGC